MIRKSNPVAVGFFTLAGIFIAFATVIYLGSVKIFSREDPTGGFFPSFFIAPEALALFDGQQRYSVDDALAA